MRRGKKSERIIVKSYSGEVSHADIMFKLVKLYLEDKGVIGIYEAG